MIQDIQTVLACRGLPDFSPTALSFFQNGSENAELFFLGAREPSEVAKHRCRASAAHSVVRTGFSPRYCLLLQDPLASYDFNANDPDPQPRYNSWDENR